MLPLLNLALDTLLEVRMLDLRNRRGDTFSLTTRDLMAHAVFAVREARDALKAERDAADDPDFYGASS